MIHLRRALGQKSTSHTTEIVPPGVEINDGKFKDNTVLVHVILPEGLCRIGNNAFQGCTSLKTISLPITLTHIGDFAFQGCNKLKCDKLPDAITHIGQCAFQGCTSFNLRELPRHLVSVGTSALYKTRIKKTITPVNLIWHFERAYGDKDLTLIHIKLWEQYKRFIQRWNLNAKSPFVDYEEDLPFFVQRGPEQHQDIIQELTLSVHKDIDNILNRMQTKTGDYWIRERYRLNVAKQNVDSYILDLTDLDRNLGNAALAQAQRLSV